MRPGKRRAHAIADYGEAIRLDPNGAKAFNNRGYAYQAKGDLDRAIADYDQAIRLNPNYDEAYLGRLTRGGAVKQAPSMSPSAGPFSCKHAQKMLTTLEPKYVDDVLSVGDEYAVWGRFAVQQPFDLSIQRMSKRSSISGERIGAFVSDGQ